ncbi:dATP/dGTP diphosphohydrolase domain-containing protein [Spirosoma sp. 209]|uniref:dATP/dGTP diphosphohydrolase domain-containing protein n=1 Tax=Spirosoma sp. 209 TaxID=1955701 RepID=UPI00098D71A7|nr:dATP/dGTP diphosphohydrolase domain-containing protein [Spirosoma sp. 209]
MTELGTRHNQGKLRWTLIDFAALKPMVQVLMHGEGVYGTHNWKKGFKATDIIDSLLRHIYAVLGGELIDPDSKLPHVGHILANAMFLSYMLLFRPDMNNLPKNEDGNDSTPTAQPDR